MTQKEQGIPVEAPDTYMVVSCRDDETVAVGKTLAAALVGRGSPDSCWGWRVVAVFGSEMRAVPKAAYAEPNPPSREEALAFIRPRAAAVAADPDSIERIVGLFRCSATDPEEKQVEEYIASAQWKLRAQPDEEWYAATSPGNPVVGEPVR